MQSAALDFGLLLGFIMDLTSQFIEEEKEEKEAWMAVAAMLFGSPCESRGKASDTSRNTIVPPVSPAT